MTVKWCYQRKILDRTQIWYADDASAIGELSRICNWFSSLVKLGPYYGYLPELNKSCLIVKESSLHQAKQLLQDHGIKITTSGHFLGGVIGDADGKHDRIAAEVHEWLQQVEILSIIAKTQPQIVYIALTKSLQCEWTDFQRVTPECGVLFEDLEMALSEKFIPACFGQDWTPSERLLFSLPNSYGRHEH